jgi:hypothetical protein
MLPDLRHHGATMALNAGYSAPIVQAWATKIASMPPRNWRASSDGSSPEFIALAVLPVEALGAP